MLLVFGVCLRNTNLPHLYSYTSALVCVGAAVGKS